MTLNGLKALNLRYFNEFGKPAFQLINRFLEHWTCWSKFGFCNTWSGKVSVRN